MKPIGDMSNHELSRFERRLKHDINQHTMQRSKPSKRRRMAMAHERDQLKTQLDAIAVEWTRRTA